mgnify:CR=1 FL=1
MNFKIPFTISDIEKLKKKSKFFSSKIHYKKESFLENYLKSADVDLNRQEYLGIVIRSFLSFFPVFLILTTTTLFFLRVDSFILFGFILSMSFSCFILFSQLVYPKIFIARKEREIEKNLLNALQDILIQLNSGVSLFRILVNISSSKYGALSEEFKKAVKRINSGEPESQVLNNIGKNNPSVLFRRTLWQISNGMVAGSDMAVVVEDSIKALNEEQLIQIQNYGNKLNPLIVMYMILTVIIPTLSITFLTIISSMVNLPSNMVILLFITLFTFVIFAQIMFLGMIKSRRPSLL